MTIAYDSIMERTSFSGMSCPVALALEHVGEWWSILILRDATHGVTRFEHFQRSLLERRRYSERPPRDEYVLTQAGHDFRPVLIALYTWGQQHFPPDEVNVRLVDRTTGLDVDPVLIDRASGDPLDDAHTEFLPGPAADDRLRATLAARAGGAG